MNKHQQQILIRLLKSKHQFHYLKHQDIIDILINNNDIYAFTSKLHLLSDYKLSLFDCHLIFTDFRKISHQYERKQIINIIKKYLNDNNLYEIVKKYCNVDEILYNEMKPLIHIKYFLQIYISWDETEESIGFWKTHQDNINILIAQHNNGETND